MTITEMRDRLNEIIKENESHNWADRNNDEVAIYIQKSPRKWEYLPIKYVGSAQVWLKNDKHVLEIRSNSTPIDKN